MYDLLQQYELKWPSGTWNVANIFRWVLLWYNYFDWQNANESIVTQYWLDREKYYKILELGSSDEERQKKMEMLYNLIKNTNAKRIFTYTETH